MLDGPNTARSTTVSFNYHTGDDGVNQSVLRRALPYLAALAAALALAATLTRAPESQAAAARTAWWCVTCGGAGVADFAVNVLLLAPLGIALALLRWRFGRTASIALALSVGIELMQGLFVTGRDAALGDVVANVLGAAMGWSVAWNWHAIKRVPSRTARGLTAGFMVAAVVTGVATTTLLTPQLGRATFTRVRFAPPSTGRPTFAGSVLLFSLNGQSFADRDVPDSLPSGPIVIDAAFTWPGPSEGTAVIARIDGVDGDAVLSLDQRANVLRVDAFAGATAWGLRNPPVGIDVPESVAAGDTVRLRYRWLANAVTMTLTTNGRTATRHGRFRPWHGWVLLNPFTGTATFDSRFALWTTVWIAAWTALVAACARAAMRRD